MPLRAVDPQRIQIGRRLAATREALAKTQKELARACEVSPSRWNHWEKGTAMPDPQAMSRLCDLFGITLDWIYRGDPYGLRANVAIKIPTSEIRKQLN